MAARSSEESFQTGVTIFGWWPDAACASARAPGRRLSLAESVRRDSAARSCAGRAGNGISRGPMPSVTQKDASETKTTTDLTNNAAAPPAVPSALLTVCFIRVARVIAVGPYVRPECGGEL